MGQLGSATAAYNTADTCPCWLVKVDEIQKADSGFSGCHCHWSHTLPLPCLPLTLPPWLLVPPTPIPIHPMPTSYRCAILPAIAGMHSLLFYGSGCTLVVMAAVPHSPALSYCLSKSAFLYFLDFYVISMICNVLVITESSCKGPVWRGHSTLPSVSRRMIVTKDRKYVPGPKVSTDREIPFFGISPCPSVIFEQLKAEAKRRDEVCMTTCMASFNFLLGLSPLEEWNKFDCINLLRVHMLLKLFTFDALKSCMPLSLQHYIPSRSMHH